MSLLASKSVFQQNTSSKWVKQIPSLGKSTFAQKSMYKLIWQRFKISGKRKSMVRPIDKHWRRGCVCSVFLVELEKMAENFSRFTKKKWLNKAKYNSVDDNCYLNGHLKNATRLKE